MKLKGVNPIEQHVEKIVLGIVVVIFLVVLSMQFVLKPNWVDVGGEKVPPDKIYTVIAEKAERLQGQLEDQEPNLPEIAEVDLEGALVETLRRPPAPSEQLAGNFGPEYSIIGGVATDLEVGGGERVASLAVPPPAEPIGYAHWTTFDPYAVQDRPALAAFVPEAQPYDVAGVTVEANFDGTSLQDALAASSEGERSIPRSLWNLALLRVEGERQEILPDGSFGTPEPVDTFSDLYDIVAETAGRDGPTPQQMGQIIQTAGREMNQITQPPYARTISGLEWLPPTDALERDSRLANSANADKIREEIARFEEEIAELEDEKNNPGRTNQRQTTPSNTDSGLTNKGGRDRNRNTNRNTDTGRNTTNDNQPTARERNIERRIENYQRQIEELQQELEDLGFEAEEGLPGSRQTQPTNIRPAPLLENEEVRMWVHDLGVENGKSYRYRMRVVVNNPLFGRGNILDQDDQQQQALAEQPLAEGLWSDWSQPVHVGQQSYFFVTTASDAPLVQDAGTLGGPLGPSEWARGEVYHMYYGYYRREVINLQPGDVVEALVALPDPDEQVLFTVDINSIEEQDLDRYLTDLDRYQQDLERWQDNENRRADDEPEMPAMPAGLAEVVRSIDVSVPAYMLDVMSSLSEGEGQQVVLQGETGELEVRDPKAETDSASYRMAVISADNAEGLRRGARRAGGNRGRPPPTDFPGYDPGRDDRHGVKPPPPP